MIKKIGTFCLLFCLFTGCTKKKAAVDYSVGLVSPLDSDQVILEYTGGTIKVKDVEARMQPQFEKLRESLLTSYINEAEKLLLERNISKLDKESSEVSPAEIANYIKANKIPQAEASKVQEFLSNEKKRLQKDLFKSQMMTSMNVVNKLGAARYDVGATKDMPQQGSKDAKVTAQVFCDFANGMCSRVRMVMMQLQTQLGNQFRWVYRHFPVASNPGSFESAKIAICAQDMDKFWPAYEVLSDLSGNLVGKDLVQLVSAKGLDKEKLKECMSNASTDTKLKSEIDSGIALGLTETPAIFINGAKVNKLDDVTPAVQKLIQ